MQSNQLISEQKYENAFSVLSEAIMLDPYRKKTKTSMENLNKQIKEKTFIEVYLIQKLKILTNFFFIKKFIITRN